MNFILRKGETHLGKGDSKDVIDSLDKGIIKFLSRNGRMSFNEIAIHLDVTEKTVRSRYNNLVDNNIIEVVGVVNPIELGIRVGAIMQLKAAPQEIEQVIDNLNQIEVIRYVSTTTGDYPLLIQVNVRDNEELNETIKAVQRIPSISSLNVLIQTEVYKNTFPII